MRGLIFCRFAAARAGIVVALAACVEGTGTDPVPVASVQVTAPADTLTAGRTVQLTVTVQDAAGNALGDRVVEWSSDKPAVATVSGSGLVSAGSPGQVTLTARSEGREGRVSLTVLPVQGAPLTFTALSTGPVANHTCAVTRDGPAYCWGNNLFGQVGDSTNTSRALPTRVLGPVRPTALARGAGHTCGLAPDGAAYCWGWNIGGMLGDGTTTFRSTPAAVLGGLKFVSFTAGQSHSCGVTSGGQGYCWGRNFEGQIGDGTFEDGTAARQRPRPTAVVGGLAFTSLTAGAFYTCALAAGGRAYCWGRNGNGQLGDSTRTDRLTPAAVTSRVAFVSLAAGERHTCGITAAGEAYCWGRNFEGQLGDGTNADRLSPTPVSGGLRFTALAAGHSHTCGLTAGGEAYCWGANGAGQLGSTGDPRTCVAHGVGSFPCSNEPRRVVGGLSFVSLAGGAAHTCALTREGRAYCWGGNDLGQLGDGTRTNRAAPSPVQAP